MSDDTVYARRVTAAGRVSYVPIGRRWDTDVWPDGHHLVSVLPRMRIVAYRVEPDLARVEAALVTVRAAMVRALVDAQRDRPDVRRTADVYGVPEATVRRAWRAWAAIMGDRVMHLETQSAAAAVEAGLDVVQARLRERTQ